MKNKGIVAHMLSLKLIASEKLNEWRIDCNPIHNKHLLKGFGCVSVLMGKNPSSLDTVYAWLWASVFMSQKVLNTIT